MNKLLILCLLVGVNDMISDPGITLEIDIFIPENPDPGPWIGRTIRTDEI